MNRRNVSPASGFRSRVEDKGRAPVVPKPRRAPGRAELYRLRIKGISASEYKSADVREPTEPKTPNEWKVLFQSQSLFSRDYGLRVAELERFQSKIKAETTNEGKSCVKRDYVESRRVYVANFLDSKRSRHNQAVSWFLVWLADCTYFPGTNYIAEFIRTGLKAVQRGQRTPPEFKRDLIVFVYDYVLIWSQREMEAKHTPRPYFDILYDRMERGSDRIEGAVAAKYYKLNGRIIVGMDQYEDERERYRDAIACYEKAGTVHHTPKVKTKLAACLKRLKQLEQTVPPSSRPGGDAGGKAEETPQTDAPDPTAPAGSTEPENSEALEAFKKQLLDF